MTDPLRPEKPWEELRKRVAEHSIGATEHDRRISEYDRRISLLESTHRVQDTTINDLKVYLARELSGMKANYEHVIVALDNHVKMFDPVKLLACLVLSSLVSGVVAAAVVLWAGR